MIELRAAETDADLQACLDLRRAVYPNEAAGTVEQERARASRPDRRLIMASLDGEVAGYGYVDRSDLPDRFALSPRVHPAWRRRGVGSALLRALAAHAIACGATKVQTGAQDEGSRAFGERFGFVETDREVEQVKALGAEARPAPPAGVEIVTLAERPELEHDVYVLGCQGFADMATEVPAFMSFEDWTREAANTIAPGSFVALAGGEAVALTELIRHDIPGTAGDGLTVVRRDWRRRGLALALKRIKLAWAAENGYREIVTWTQRGNEGMRRVNELLGYEYRTVSVTLVATLPLSVRTAPGEVASASPPL